MFFPTCVHILGVVVPVLFLFPNERQEIAEKQETLKKTNGFKKNKKNGGGFAFSFSRQKEKKSGGISNGGLVYAYAMQCGSDVF